MIFTEVLLIFRCWIVPIALVISLRQIVLIGICSFSWLGVPFVGSPLGIYGPIRRNYVNRDVFNREVEGPVCANSAFPVKIEKKKTLPIIKWNRLIRAINIPRAPPALPIPI